MSDNKNDTAMMPHERDPLPWEVADGRGSLTEAVVLASPQPGRGSARSIVAKGDLQTCEFICRLANARHERLRRVGHGDHVFLCGSCATRFNDPEPKCVAGPKCPRCGNITLVKELGLPLAEKMSALNEYMAKVDALWVEGEVVAHEMPDSDQEKRHLLEYMEAWANTTRNADVCIVDHWIIEYAAAAAAVKEQP